MCGDDEVIKIFFDCDLMTNNKTCSGIFKDPAIHRRIFPIKKIIPADVSKEEQGNQWGIPHGLIENPEFIKSYVKFVKEEELDQNNFIPNQNPLPRREFMNEIINSTMDTFDLWLSDWLEGEYRETPKKLTNKTYKTELNGRDRGFNSGYLLDDVYKSYKNYCVKDGQKFPLGKPAFIEKIKKIGVSTPNPLHCVGGRFRLWFFGFESYFKELASLTYKVIALNKLGKSIKNFIRKRKKNNNENINENINEIVNEAVNENIVENENIIEAVNEMVNEAVNENIIEIENVNNENDNENIIENVNEVVNENVNNDYLKNFIINPEDEEKLADINKTLDDRKQQRKIRAEERKRLKTLNSKK
jgi:hypothetical protein